MCIKLSVLIALLLVSASSSHAQTLLNLSDSVLWKQYKESGVQTLKVQTRLFTQGKADKLNTKMAIVLNKQGQLSLYQHFAGNKIKYQLSYTYTSNGQEKSKATLQPNGDTARYQLFSYNTQNLLIKSITKDAQNKLIFQEYKDYNEHGDLTKELKINHQQDSSSLSIKWRYDSLNRVVQKTELNPNSDRINNWYYIYTNLKSYLLKIDHPILGQMMVSGKSFDNEGRLVGHTFYDNQGQLITEHLYKYQDNHVIEETIFDMENDTEFVIKRRLKKDGRTKRELGKYRLDDRHEYHYKMSYSFKRLLKKVVVIPNDGEPRYVRKYRYDQRKNLQSIEYYQDGEKYRESLYTITYHP